MRAAASVPPQMSKDNCTSGRRAGDIGLEFGAIVRLALAQIQFAGGQELVDTLHLQLAGGQGRGERQKHLVLARTAGARLGHSASRHHCRRISPSIISRTVSRMRAISRLKARSANKAGALVGGRKQQCQIAVGIETPHLVRAMPAAGSTGTVGMVAAIMALQ